MNSSGPTRVAIYGASGQMGQVLLQACRGDTRFEVVAAMLRADAVLLDSPVPGYSQAVAGELLYCAALDPDTAVDTLIDFSVGAAFDNGLAIAVEHSLAFVSGTTGLTPAQHLDLRRAAQRIPVLWSANFSLGVALLKRLAAQATVVLGPDFDIEIVETHHAHKEDAPSGTALALGEVIAQVRGDSLDVVARRSRDGLIGARPHREIGFSTVRGGDVVGEHTVMFFGRGERLEICHRATSRELFARGALRAARWLHGQPAGMYSLEDVIAAES